MSTSKRAVQKISSPRGKKISGPEPVKISIYWVTGGFVDRHMWLCFDDAAKRRSSGLRADYKRDLHVDHRCDDCGRSSSQDVRPGPVPWTAPFSGPKEIVKPTLRRGPG